MKFFFTESLGPKRKLTPEGYLLCEDVPIARVGTQLYAEGEVPVPAVRGVISIERNEEDVFRDATIASANGKDVVDDHPMDEGALEDGWDVNPHNYRLHTRGTVLNARRGEGAQRDYLLADLLVKDADAIQAVMDGKVEVSCGYNADYETLADGRGRQHNILFNHVALVAQGRCGPRCSIGDEDMLARTRDKGKSGNPTLDKAFAALDRLKRSFRTGDKTKDELLEAGMEEIEEGLDAASEAGTGSAAEKVGEHHVHVHLPGAGGSKGQEVSDEGVDPATGAGEGEGGGEIGERIGRLEALFTKFAPILEKLAGQQAEPKPSAADEEVLEEGDEGDELEEVATGDSDLFAGEVEMDDPHPAATGDNELFSGEVEMDDPHPAATGDKTKDGMTVMGLAVKDPKTGKVTVQEIKKPAVKVRDSAHLKDRFTEVLAAAEVLAPGIKLPTYDHKLPAAKTIDAMCGLRRRALARAWMTEDGKAAIQPLFQGDLGKKLPSMTCDSVKLVFNGATELRRVANNAAAGGSGTLRTADSKKPLKTIADVNARNREVYGQPKNG